MDNPCRSCKLTRVRRYFDVFFPLAADLGDKWRAGGGPAKNDTFIWMTQSWIVSLFLNCKAARAVDEAAILLHPPPPVVGVSIAMGRERQQNDSLVNGQAAHYNAWDGSGRNLLHCPNATAIGARPHSMDYNPTRWP